LVDSGDFICVVRQPALRPVLPPESASGWYGLEGTAQENWRWSSGDAKLILHNADSIAKPVHLTFGLATFKPRFVSIIVVPEASTRPLSLQAQRRIPLK
jgi:hypothetical protein